MTYEYSSDRFAGCAFAELVAGGLLLRREALLLELLRRELRFFATISFPY